MTEPSVWDQVVAGYRKIPPLWRDIGIAFLVIFILMGSLWAYTGQPLDQAPLVVVESGSMMHEDPPYGRIGTIDPGDLILVKDVGGIESIDTLYGSRAPDRGRPGEGDRDGYGAGGDVIIYRQDQCPRGLPTPIIHRAITWVEVRQTGAARTFSYHDSLGNWRVDQTDVHLPELGISHMDEFRESGWITKGDNPDTNRQADQVLICEGRLVQQDWVVGKARGEIPWVGLLKFIVQGNNVQVVPQGWCHVGNAKAPCDTFTMLWVSLGVVILVPLLWDVGMRWRRGRMEP